MATRARTGGLAVGVADHAGWAICVTAARDGALIDRRRVELIEPGLPCLPHHHEAQRLPVDEGVALVERVRRSAEACAAAALEALAESVPRPVVAIALRECPVLPPTVALRLASYWAQNRADSVMYRTALATAATARGWAVCWYDARRALADAAAALGQGTVDELLARTGAALGPPWRQDHKVAMSAAIAAAARR